MNRGKIRGLFSVVLLSFLLVSCGQLNNYDKVQRTAGSHSLKQLEPNKHKEPMEFKQEITIAAIGDMLIHDVVYNDAKRDGGYNFKPMLERVKPFLSDATITVANQETMIGGTEIGLSTYPSFNSPQEVGDDLKWAGVDVVTLANNHTLDRGEEAIQRALAHWDKLGMMYTGAYKNKQDQENIRVYETDEGISVAFLAYTYGTNGIPVPEGKDYLVNLIDKDLISRQVQEAQEKADVVVTSLHFGNEYERMPNQTQEDLVQFLADQGVNVVIGHHPHVLQPIDWVDGKDGNRTLVVYSLGNFLSGQDEFYRRIGGIFKFTITKSMKNEQKTITVNTPEFLPTYVYYKGSKNFQVIPMYQLSNEELPEAAQVYKEIEDHMAQFVPDVTFIEK